MNAASANEPAAVRELYADASPAPRSTASPAPAPATLIDVVIAGTGAAVWQAPSWLERFLTASSQAEALRLWMAPWIEGDGAALAAAHAKQAVLQRLNRDVAALDAMLNAQVNAILHHPAFQKLEASWRGLKYLVDQADGCENVKIRVFNTSWKELARDAERAIEFDQSQLFRKVYSDEFDMPGGEPYGLLIGDYDVRHRVASDHPVDDVAVLRSISQVAAAAFAPFIAAAEPAMFGLDDFDGLQYPLNLPRIFEQAEYLKWRALRDSEDARFLGLTLPRILLRTPYEDDPARCDGFCFRERVEEKDSRHYLWGNAAFGFAAVVVRAFAQSGWLAEIRGVQRDTEDGGIVTGLPSQSFGTDRAGVALKSSTDVVVTDQQEKTFGELGFIPLCRCLDTEYSAFYGCASIQKPKAYDTVAATVNAKLSSMLQCILCVSRFAHYLKVITRDKLGAFAEPTDLETDLHRWLQQYVTSDDLASVETKARYPLREARVQVHERPGKPGNYLCVLHLRPHFQLDELTASVRLVTELTPGRPA